MPAANVTVNATFLAEWKWLQNRMAAGGDIKLGNDITCLDQSEGPLNVPEGVTVTLDLNGCVINRALTAGTSNGSVITVNGTLTVKDSRATEEHRNPSITLHQPRHEGDRHREGRHHHRRKNSGNGGGVYVAAGGAFTMNDSSITSNSFGNGSPEFESFGGGVYVAKRGTFTMNGGEITDNGGSANEYVHFFGTGVANAGTFIVSGDARVVYNRIGDAEEGDVYLPNGNVITVTGALGEKAVFNVTAGALSEDDYVTICLPRAFMPSRWLGRTSIRFSSIPSPS